MSSARSILELGTRGVDMRTNPFQLGIGKVAFAQNIVFDESESRTRFGYYYHNLGLSGRLQDAKVVNLGKGLSRGKYGYDADVLVIIIDGKAWFLRSEVFFEGDKKRVSFCCPQRICDLEWDKCEEVRIQQVEDYVVFYGRNIETSWWDGESCEISPGMEERACSNIDERCYEPESFCDEDIKNWIPHNLCSLAYAHGRSHAQVGSNTIYVGDMLHKRAEDRTSDVLKFNEQAHDSYGDPIGVPSSSGCYITLENFPAMGTVYGEGDIVGYTSCGGIVTHPTNIFPRQSRYTAQGENITKGWKYEKMVTRIVNTVTAVGYNAVTVTPRDHFFASDYGVHFLTQITGEGSFNDETTKTLSQDIEPLYRIDSPALTHGRSTGHWLNGSRFFVTVGMIESEWSNLPVAKGYASMNQALTYTEDRTPLPVWEGLHTVDDDMVIHKFLSSTKVDYRGAYGFLASSSDGMLYFAEMCEGLTHDIRDDEEIPIEWEVETGKSIANRFTKTSVISDGTLRYITDDADLELSVMKRTSHSCCWESWRTMDICSDKIDESGRVVSVATLGQPPKDYRESAWSQYRIQGKGYAELESFQVWYEDGTQIKSKNYCKCAGERVRDYRNCLGIDAEAMYKKQSECGDPLKLEEPCTC